MSNPMVLAVIELSNRLNETCYQKNEIEKFQDDQGLKDSSLQ